MDGCGSGRRESHPSMIAGSWYGAGRGSRRSTEASARPGGGLALAAGHELEQLVASQSARDAEGDVDMRDAGEPLLTSSWVAISGDDWEMIDCAA